MHILGLLFFMVAFEHGLSWVIAAALIAGAGLGLLSPALTVVVSRIASRLLAWAARPPASNLFGRLALRSASARLSWPRP